MMQVTTKAGQLKEFVKTMLEKNLSIIKQQPGFVDAMALTSNTERIASNAWLRPRTSHHAVLRTPPQPLICRRRAASFSRRSRK